MVSVPHLAFMWHRPNVQSSTTWAYYRTKWYSSFCYWHHKVIYGRTDTSSPWRQLLNCISFSCICRQTHQIAKMSNFDTSFSSYIQKESCRISKFGAMREEGRNKIVEAIKPNLNRSLKLTLLDELHYLRP